jgi:DNA-binding NarL/FixJ family response regulator
MTRVLIADDQALVRVGLRKILESEPDTARRAAPRTTRSRSGSLISEGTVKTHVAHILRKLNVRDRVQAVIYAYEWGAVEVAR